MSSQRAHPRLQGERWAATSVRVRQVDGADELLPDLGGGMVISGVDLGVGQQCSDLARGRESY